MTKQSAIERAEALLTRWGKRLSSADEPSLPAIGVPEGAEERADGPRQQTGQKTSGRGLVKGVAHVYVVLAAKAGELAEPLVKTWQEGVGEAQRQQAAQAAQIEGTAGAHQEEADEKEGQQALKDTAGAATQAAGAAA